MYCEGHSLPAPTLPYSCVLKSKPRDDERHATPTERASRSWLFPIPTPQERYSQGAVLKVLVYLRTTCVGFLGLPNYSISAHRGGHSGLRRASAEKRSHRGNPRAPGGNHAERRPSLLVKIPQRQLLPSKHAP